MPRQQTAETLVTETQVTETLVTRPVLGAAISFSIFMDDGKIVERGTHSQLLKKRGVYTSMVTSQALAQQMEITLQ